MKPRAGRILPATLLLLALAALASGCNASPSVSAAGQEGVPFTTFPPTLGVGIPVTGFGLEIAGCDPRGSFINFRLSDPVSGNTATQLQVEFSGRSALCNNPLGDASVLSCSIPSLTVFPTLVVIRMDDVVITEFTYDGTACAVDLPALGAQTVYPSSIPTTTATDSGLPATFSVERLPTTMPTLWLTLTALPTWTGQPTPTEPPPTEPPVTEPPATEPAPTDPPATEPPPTDPPPTPDSKPAPTHRATPTHKPTITPKPPHPTEPPPTEPPPTPSGDLNSPGPRLAGVPGQEQIAA